MNTSRGELCAKCANEYRCDGICPCEYWPKRESNEDIKEEEEED